MNDKAVAVAQGQSVAEVKAQVNRIQEVMRAVMKQDVHYGVITGTQKPTLYKAGAEVLLSTFMISVEPEIDDISTDDHIRYRVKAIGRHQTTGIVIGVGVGEASTNEEKYKWRKVVCDEEFDVAEEDKRRVKFSKYQGNVSKVFQIRTEPADLANTVLKMAKKRAQIDLCLTALAASDIFTQDLDDLPPGMAGNDNQQAPGKPHTAAPQSTSGQSNTNKPCTSKQAHMVSSRLDDSGIPENQFLKHFNIDEVKLLPFSKVDEALEWMRKSLEE